MPHDCPRVHPRAHHQGATSRRPLAASRLGTGARSTAAPPASTMRPRSLVAMLALLTALTALTALASLAAGRAAAQALPSPPCSGSTAPAYAGPGEQPGLL